MSTAPIARLVDRLAPDEPHYKSRGETQVGRLLDRYGIPFLYEQPTVLHDRGRYSTWRPDFTLPTYDNLIVEYAGMMDVPGYATGIQHKRRVYAENGLRAMFVYPRDLGGPSWPERLVHRFYQAGRIPGRSTYRHHFR